MYDSSFTDLPTYSLLSNTYALVMRHVFTTSAVIHYQEPTQRHENIEYFCMFRIHMFFEKGIPQEVVIHRCSHRFCDINTESTLFRGKSEHIQRHFLSYHIIGTSISNLYQIIIIVLDEVLRRKNRGLRGPQSHTQQ